MKPLPQWSIEQFAQGSGAEARLARMVLELQQELTEANQIIDEHERMAAKRSEANRQLVEVAERLREQLDRLRDKTPGWGDVVPAPRPKFWLGKS